jgi:hypothetical protein
MCRLSRHQLEILFSLAALTPLSIAQAQPAAGGTAGQVTFTKDVAPILQRSCQNCHRAGSIAPMSLLTYEETRPWARSIKEKVAQREMPPWYIDRNVGIKGFRNDVSLPDSEIATIVKWVDGGAQKGNPADMPPASKFEGDDIWHIGKPELIVSLPKDEVVLAHQPDQWKDVIVDPHITEDRYLMAVETKPTKGFRVVHHAVTFTNTDEAALADGIAQGTFLNEYAVGKNGDTFPEDAGRLFKAGTKIVFNLHLHANGEATKLNVSLGLKFYPKGYVPKHIEKTETTGYQSDLDFPANTDNIRADGYTFLTKPTRLLSFQPHMHNRGKAMCMEAIYPRVGPEHPNQVETLSCVNKYRFGWHIVYLYQDDVQPVLPAGTILHVISWHDNTTANKYNPDPDNWVGYGQRSIDDMSFAWVSSYELTDEDYKQITAERKAKKNAIVSELQ